MRQNRRINNRKADASRRFAGCIAITAACSTVAARADSFAPFPSSSVRIAAAVLAAGADVPMGAGVVYDPSGNANDINVVNFGTTIYTGPINVSTTITRIRDNQSVYKDESDDGGFFNFNPGELPNIPRMGMNYYMEFMVWPAMNLSAGTFDTTALPYNSSSSGSPDTFPGPERILVGSAGEVYYTGDHYSTNDYVNPATPLPAITVNSWSATSGSWNTAGNWSGGHVPVAGEAAYLSVADENSRTVTYNFAGSVTLGDFLVNADGTQTSHGSMLFQQSQGTLTTAREEVWARYASAGVIQSGGTDTVQGTLHVGSLVASVGAYNLSGGSLTAANEFIGSTELVAAAGTGSFNQTGGVHTVTGTINLGYSAGGTGTYLMQAGTLSAGAINVNTGGTFNQTGGTLNLTGSLANFATVILGGTQNYSSGATFTNNAGATAVFTTDAGATAQTLNASVAGGAVNFNTSQHLASLNISGGTVLLNKTGPTRSIIFTPQLNISAGQLNLAGNDLIVQGGSLAAVNTLVAEGCSNGAWNGMGITSSTAAADTTHLTAVGVIQNNQSGSALYSSGHLFDGVAPGTADILACYTWYGDANLDGEVDGSDYSRIDNGYLSQGSLTGWFNGDFNYDGVIDGSDYTLIDNTFNQQGAALTAEVAALAQIASATAVPEPASLALVALVTALLGRRRW